MLFRTVDEKLYQDHGFYRIGPDTEYGACYRRYVNEHDYSQRVDILHKKSGKHLIQSYQEDVNKDGFNNVVGLTYKELKLFMKKYRQLKRRFGWK